MVFLACDTQIDHISWHDIRHKDYKVIYSHKRLAFCCNILYFHLLVNGQFFLFSRHI